MIDAQVRNDDFLPFILGKLMGKMRLSEGTTEQDEIEMYRATDHVNYFINSGNGFLCVARYKNFVFIPFAWYTGDFRAHREMVQLGKELYKHYTIKQGKPIYYTGLKNFYKSNSREVMEYLWIFEPKNI